MELRGALRLLLRFVDKLKVRPLWPVAYGMIGRHEFIVGICIPRDCTGVEDFFWGKIQLVHPPRSSGNSENAAGKGCNRS